VPQVVGVLHVVVLQLLNDLVPRRGVDGLGVDLIGLVEQGLVTVPDHELHQVLLHFVGFLFLHSKLLVLLKLLDRGIHLLKEVDERVILPLLSDLLPVVHVLHPYEDTLPI